MNQNGNRPEGASNNQKTSNIDDDRKNRELIDQLLAQEMQA